MIYHFLPYSRRAAAATVTGAETDSSGRPRGLITLTAEVRERDGAVRTAPPHAQPYTLLGPGDVTGIDPGQVLLTSPRAGTQTMEPNYLAHVEFAHPDLPWLFSPEAPDAAGHLRPWIALVVVEERSGLRVLPHPDSPNPVLEAVVDELPVLDDAWAWAHVQVAEAGAPPADVLADPVRYRGLVLSRLLAPRRLQHDTAYVACVVPTYESGRQAGLGDIPTGGRAPAWTPATGAVRLPVYYHWRFRTGPAGDFESLAGRLRPVSREAIKAKGVGQREVYLDPVLARLQLEGSGEPLFPPLTLPMRTAIAQDSDPGSLSLAPESDHPSEPTRTALARRLKLLVDFPERARREGGEPVVAPPIYGQWHAEKRSLDDALDSPDVTLPAEAAWVTELNADVETRGVAGLGTGLVQHDQEALMALAWEQLERVAEANRRARWGQLFQSASVKLFASRVERRDPGSLLRLASPALGRLRFEGQTTVAARIQATALPRAIVGASFTRMTRFAGRAATRLPSDRVLSALVTPMLANRFDVTPSRLGAAVSLIEPAVFGRLLDQAGVAESVKERTGLSVAEHVSRLADLPRLVRAAEERLQTDGPSPVTQSPVSEEPAIYVDIAAHSQQAQRVRSVARRLIAREAQTQLSGSVRSYLRQIAEQPASESLQVPTDVLAAVNARLGAGERGRGALDVLGSGAGLTASSAQRVQLQRVLAAGRLAEQTVPAVERFSVLRSATLAQFHVDQPVAPAIAARLDDGVLATIGEAARGIEERLTVPEQRIPLPALQPLAAADVKGAVVSRFEPTIVYDALLAWANRIPEAGPRAPRRRSPSHQIMAAPRFDEPAVERLKRIDRDWVLGHADALPPNSISCLVANARFVEAFLVGANWEMARELQWRQYPTDQMGTCFARFWPSPSGAPDDVAPLPTWNMPLGQNGPDDDRNPGEEVVIVIRGDLLRRYPNTVVGAIRGRTERQSDGLRFVPDEQTPPVRELFRGFLDPDITYSGLAISTATLRQIVPGDPNRWYIALTQPADEPRFGLDEEPGTQPGPVATLNDLSWQSLPPNLMTASGILRVSQAIPGQDDWQEGPGETDVRWGPGSNAGQVASILFQRPFRVLLRASEFVPEDDD